MNRLVQSAERAASFARDVLIQPRKLGRVAASAVVFAVSVPYGNNIMPQGGQSEAAASGLLETDGGGVKLAKPFNIQAAYPNFGMSHHHYLEGTNDFQPGYNPNDPKSSDRAVITEQDMGIN